MQGSNWAGLINRIPEKYHEILVVMTTSGAEIMVQRIIKLDDDVLIFRGRPTGSTEHARTILLPFDQVNYIAFAKPVVEKDVLAMFAPSENAAVAAPEQTQPEASAASEDQASAEEAPVQDATPLPESVKAPEAPPGSLRSGPPSKTMLLARLRARLAKENSP